MKALKIILGILGGLVCLFLAIGLMFPSVSYSNEIAVNAPVDKVWAVFENEEKMGDWLEGFEGSRLISGEPNSIGSRYEMTFVEEGEKMLIIETITEYKPQEKFGMHLDNDVMEIETEISFRSEGNQTIINSKNVVKGKNILWKAMFVFMKSTFISGDEQSYNRLKSIIESS